jgi:chromosome segregation ATPase
VNTPQASIIDQIADERDELRDQNQKLKHRIEMLESANSDVARIAKERDDALMMLGPYRIKSDEQKERIKRLEESITFAKDRYTEHQMLISKLRARLARLGLALRHIAGTDYRGNRSIDSQIAAEALKSKP